MSSPRQHPADELRPLEPTDAAQGEDVPALGPSDSSDTGSDSVHVDSSEADTLPLPPRRPAPPEDENADPVGHGDTEPDGSPLPPPAGVPPWRGRR